MEVNAASATAAASAARAPEGPAPEPAVPRPQPAQRPPVLGRAVPFTFAQARQRWPLLLPALALLPLLLGLAALVDGGRLLVWDAPLTAQAVAHRSPWIDDLALSVSRLGAWPVVYSVGALLAALAACRSRRLAMVILVVVACRPAFEWLLKDLVARPRPEGHRLVAGTGYSFPSGHVLAATATWAFLPPVLALYTHRRTLWWAGLGGAAGIVGMVAWSRVWLGVHWTSDVVASLAIATVALSAAESWLDAKGSLTEREQAPDTVAARHEQRPTSGTGTSRIADAK
jgi:undecaprenyl-diphosphatase